jgi:hypothetical protein
MVSFEASEIRTLSRARFGRCPVKVDGKRSDASSTLLTNRANSGAPYSTPYTSVSPHTVGISV